MNKVSKIKKRPSSSLAADWGLGCNQTKAASADFPIRPRWPYLGFLPEILLPEFSEGHIRELVQAHWREGGGSRQEGLQPGEGRFS